MKRKVLKTLITIFAALLAAELLFVGFMFFSSDTPPETVPEEETEESIVPAVPLENTATTSTEVVAAVASDAATIPATETAEPTETEPVRLSYTLTFVGDCTLGSEPGKFSSPYSFVGTVGENYEYPFANVLEYFENDDLTLINLEGVFADSGYAQDKTFTFRGPTAYTEILTGSSVEAVTLANNHSYDFGSSGYNTTKEVLDAAGVSYVEENKTCLITTESGLVVGLYADAFQFSTGEIAAHVENLKKAGAEIIVCAFHWGTEGSYRANSTQETYAKSAIDAGADIVWGHHPHVLQKIEQYKDGVILYSLGNFSFGGNHFPRDYDSAVVQQEVLRNEDGSVSLGELTIIPVSISSMEGQNNFQPTPYEEGSTEYDRVLSKLDGTFTGPDLVVNYEKETTPATTAPAATAVPETQVPAGTEAPGETAAPTQAPAADAPAQTQAPAQPENNETSG